MPSAADRTRLTNEISQLGVEIYNRRIKPTLVPQDYGKFVAIAIDEEDFQIDSDDHAAVLALLARRPKADVWLMRIGEPVAYRIGTGRR